jgi:hypothetical protein
VTDEPILDARIMGMLRESMFVRVATITPRGRPHLAPFWFATDGERIVISTLHNQTVRNLLANPDAAVLVDLGHDFRELRGAQIRGDARVYRDHDALPPAVQALMAEIDRVHARELTEPEFERYGAWERREHITLEITPRSATWFDLGRAEAGRTGPASRAFDGT